MYARQELGCFIIGPRNIRWHIFSYAICLSNKFVIDQDDSYLDKHNHCVNEVDIKFCNSLLIANESNHSKI